MDIYVATLNGAVVGSAVDLESAQTIAGRGANRSAFESDWGPWTHREGTDVWSRQSRFLQTQKIVRVPLAGWRSPSRQTWDGSTSPVEDLRAFSAQRMARLGYHDMIDNALVAKMSETPPVTKDRLMDLMKAVKKIPAPGKIRIGKGEALDWFRRALDQVPTYPSGHALPDSLLARFMGFDVALDPELPPNVMKVGGKMFVIYGDSIISIDETVLDLMSPTPRYFTNPAG